MPLPLAGTSDSRMDATTGSGALDPHVTSCRIVVCVEEHLTVGRVAELAGVTARTLHHYDAIGLVRPSARTPAGYRAYSADLVDDPAAGAAAHQHRLRGLLLEQRDRADATVTAIDRELTARAKGTAVTPEE